MKTRTVTLVFLFLIALFGQCNERNRSRFNGDNGSVSIGKSIQDSSFVKIIDYFEESYEGGNIFYYVQSGHLRKIEVHLYGEMGKVTRVLTLEGTRLLRYREVIRIYDKPFYISGSISVKDSTSIEVEFANNAVINIAKSGMGADTLTVTRIVHLIDARKNKYLAIFEQLGSK